MDLGPFLDGTWSPPRPRYFTRTDGISLLYPGLVHSVSGESESGKSLIIQHEAAVLVGQQRPVLYLDFESDPGAVTERLRRFGTLPADVRDHFAYVSPTVDPDRAGSNRAAEQDAYLELLGHRWALVVIDGVTEALAIYGKASNDNDEVTQFIRALPRRFAQETGAAVVLIDHLSKSADTRGRYAIGAQAKMATVSGAAYLVEPKGPIGRGRRGTIEVRLAKDRAGYLRDHCGPWRPGDRTQSAALVEIDSTHADITQVTVGPPKDGPDDNKPFRPTTLMENISKHLEDQTEGQSTRQIETMVQGKAAVIRQALALLVADGYVAMIPGPRSSHLHTSKRPYRQENDPASDRYRGDALPVPDDD